MVGGGKRSGLVESLLLMNQPEAHPGNQFAPSLSVLGASLGALEVHCVTTKVLFKPIFASVIEGVLLKCP